MSATLDQLTATWREIEARLDETGGEITPDVDEKLAAFSLMEADKVDAYGAVITDLRGRAKATKEAQDDLARKRATLDSRADWLEGRVRQFAEARGVREVRGQVYRFGYRKHGGVAPLLMRDDADPAGLAGSPLVKTTHAWDRTAVREAVEHAEHPAHAEAVVIASIGPRGESFRLT